MGHKSLRASVDKRLPMRCLDNVFIKSLRLVILMDCIRKARVKFGALNPSFFSTLQFLLELRLYLERGPAIARGSNFFKNYFFSKNSILISTADWNQECKILYCNIFLHENKFIFIFRENKFKLL